MQLLPRYLIINKFNIIVNESGLPTEYQPVYTRQLEIYKGIDNTIQFGLLNADQKPVDVYGQEVRFVAIDENQHQCLDIVATPAQWDDSTIRTGVYVVTISRNDLLDIDPQYIKYYLSIQDFDNYETLTYANTHFGVAGIGQIHDTINPRPDPVKSTTFSSIAYLDDNWYTDPVPLAPGINSNVALHTAAVYTNGYVGTITLEASLENNSADPEMVWSEIDKQLVLSGDETEPVPVNFYGVYNYVRFRADSDPETKIPKILIRT